MGSPAVLDRTVIVLDRTVIILDRTVIVLDRSVIAIYGIFSLNFLRLGGGSDRLWLLRAVRHTSAPALPTLSILRGDRFVCKTLSCAGLFPGAWSCAFKFLLYMTLRQKDRWQATQMHKRWLHRSICDPPPRNESQCAKPTFAVTRNLLHGGENVGFEILVAAAKEIIYL